MPPANRNPFDAESADQLVAAGKREFASRFGGPPDCVVAAPGRVNLIGEHIDYNDGLVLPMAVERFVVLVAAARQASGAPRATFYSSSLEEETAIRLDRPLQPGPQVWSRYLAGVIHGFQQRNVAIPPLDAVIVSNLPLGSGLSSSAALQVATATLLEFMTDTPVPPWQKVLLCQQAEHDFAGVPCGIMDPFCCVFSQPGEFLLLDCRSRQMHPVPFANPDLAVLICNSNVSHQLATSEYARRRQQCDAGLAKLNRSSWREVTPQHLATRQNLLTDVEYRRARHVVSEITRTADAAAAIRGGDWRSAGEWMNASHDSLRDDYEVSCPELDSLVEIAREIGPPGGVYGSRMTGGGFGGCTVSLVKAKLAESVMATLAPAYHARTGRQATCFSSRPAAGAGVVFPTNSTR